MPHSRCDCPVHKFCKGTRDYGSFTNDFVFSPAEKQQNAESCPNW
jgi:hypothetical protein